MSKRTVSRAGDAVWPLQLWGSAVLSPKRCKQHSRPRIGLLPGYSIQKTAQGAFSIAAQEAAWLQGAQQASSLLQSSVDWCMWWVLGTAARGDMQACCSAVLAQNAGGACAEFRQMRELLAALTWCEGKAAGAHWQWQHSLLPGIGLSMSGTSSADKVRADTLSRNAASGMARQAQQSSRSGGPWGAVGVQPDIDPQTRPHLCQCPGGVWEMWV